jgi:hypothetical protein
MTVGGDSSLMVNRSLDGASIANIRQNGSLQDTYPSIGENRACEGHSLNNRDQSKTYIEACRP